MIPRLSPHIGAIMCAWSQRTAFQYFAGLTAPVVYDSIGIAYYTELFMDTALDNDTTYCYYIQGFGAYTAIWQPLSCSINGAITRTHLRSAGRYHSTLPTCPHRNQRLRQLQRPAGPILNMNHLRWHIITDSMRYQSEIF